MHMYVYEPADDSWMLANELKKRKCRRFLDMGCGSGVQANSIGRADEIVCADVNPDAVETAKNNVKTGNARFVVSNLFDNITGRFDLIAFNTPYLDDADPRDMAWTHIQNGEDVIEKFILQAKNHITKDGKILLLISDRNYDGYKLFAMGQGYNWKIIAEKPLFFETLYVVELSVQ